MERTPGAEDMKKILEINEATVKINHMIVGILAKPPVMSTNVKDIDIEDIKIGAIKKL